MGCLFGFLFPIVSFSIRVVEMGLSFSLPALVEVHANSALQWIIDTAPLFLGLFAYIAGRRQQKVLELNRQLTRYIDDNRDQLIDQLQKSVIQSEEEAQRSLAQLRTAAQIAKQSTSFSADVPAATLNELLDKALDDSTQLISEQFSAYHVGIFLIESSSTASSKDRQYATLVASNSKGGQHMLKRGHKLKIGGPGVGTGIVGYVAAEGKPKIALDVGAEAVYFDNPDLPDTRSEMALPLVVSGKIIGVLDVQSTHSAAFAERDVVVMGLIAEGLSSTIDNARLILQLRSSLDEVRQLHQQYLQKAWSETLALEKTLEYSSAVSSGAEILPGADLLSKEVSSLSPLARVKEFPSNCVIKRLERLAWKAFPGCKFQIPPPAETRLAPRLKNCVKPGFQKKSSWQRQWQIRLPRLWKTPAC